MNYFPNNFKTKYFKNMKIIKKNVNRLVFLNTLYNGNSPILSFFQGPDPHYGLSRETNHGGAALRKG